MASLATGLMAAAGGMGSAGMFRGLGGMFGGGGGGSLGGMMNFAQGFNGATTPYIGGSQSYMNNLMQPFRMI
jgi:hypothetical protein